MYRTACQRGMFTIFYSVGSKPLKIWDVHCQDGYVTRFLDQDIKSMVLEIRGNNVSTTYMTCPNENRVLGITMPFLVMVVKNLKKYFTFEVTILDETGTRRRFRASNFQSSTQILPLCTVMPISLADGWNQIQFNLAEFTRRAYQKQLVEVQKVKINANIRLRRIYFSEKLMPEDQLPPEYRLFFPLQSKQRPGTDKQVEDVGKAIEEAQPIPEAVVAPAASRVVQIQSKASVRSIHRRSELEHPTVPEPAEIVEPEEIEAPITEEIADTEGVEGGAGDEVPLEGKTLAGDALKVDQVEPGEEPAPGGDENIAGGEVPTDGAPQEEQVPATEEPTPVEEAPAVAEAEV